MKYVLLVLVLCVAFVAAQDEHPVRVSNKQESPLPEHLEDRASAFFRRIDTDYDKHIGEGDIQRGEHVLAEQMPGISVTQFLEFMSKADQDNDKRLSHDEFMHAIALGLNDASQEEEATLLETDAARRTHKQGFIGAVANFAKGVFDNAKTAVGGIFRRITGAIDKSQDSCVMCQYIVERIETNVKAAGVIPGLGAPNPAMMAFVEVDEQTSEIPGIALVEVEEKGPYQVAGASVISSTRQTTRFQRQLERQKFNEIYRIADITLDDVCEQGMPNTYYGFCKSVYKAQSDIVDGLRYQYRPVDVCYRVGMCKKNSYITKGIHSRYRTDN